VGIFAPDTILNNVQNILLIRLKSIGDVILTLPAVNAVRDNFPAAKITFLTSKENAALLGGFREVNEIIAIDRDALRGGNPLKMAPEFFRLLRRLRAGKFDLAVDFQGYGETAWLARLTGAPQRWGSGYHNVRKWAYTQGANRDDKMQIAEIHLFLIRQCGLSIGPVRNEFFLPAEARLAAQQFFSTHQLAPAKPTLLVQAFTSSRHKNWPLENYLKLAAHFRAAGTQIVFGGGPGDAEALRPAREAGFVIAAGVPLLTAAGLAALSTVVLGGVTGLLHLAVAVQKRVVMLVGYPAGEPGFPYQHRDWAVVPDGKAGTANIPLVRVMEACERAFSEEASKAAC
jgi:ADP-heptose:LPS heptosyltransferase